MCKRNYCKVLIFILLIFFSFSLFATNSFYDENGHSPFSRIAKELTKSVVNIKVEWEVTGFNQNLPFDNDFFKFFFPHPPNTNRKSVGFASGFIFRIDKDNIYIITNNHVVEKGAQGEITVTLFDGSKHEAEIIGLDSDSDIAIVKIELDNQKKIYKAPLGNSDSLLVGDWVLAIGNPLSPQLTGSVTVGVVSAKGRANLNFGANSPVYQDYIQTDAAINPGNSGGPLVDINGKVVGVNAAISTVSGGNIGIGFAVPINIVKNVVADIIEKGYVERAFLGILPQAITPLLKNSLDLNSLEGILIGKVENNTPAEKAGLKKKDVIIEFNDKPVKNVSKFRLMVANARVGENVDLKIIRNGNTIEKTVKLISRPKSEIAQSQTKQNEVSDWLGIKVEDLDSQHAKQFNIAVDKGVVVTKILVDSPADASELSVGDVILEIEKSKIESVADFYITIEKLKKQNKETILFYLNSGKNVYRFVAIKLK